MATLINQTTFLPIINGFVEVPDIGNTRIRPDDVIAIIPDAKITTFAINKQQRFLELPTFDRWDGYTEDWFQQMRDVATRYG